jgi:acyl-CoA synthetase (AMP-forming)/AMP-acid ligase II
LTTDLIRSTFPSASASDFGRSLICPSGPFEVTEENVLGEPMAVFAKRPSSLLQLLTDAAVPFGERDYLVDDERLLTYGETVAAMNTLATVLRDEYGVRPGDRVGVHAANSLEWILTFWAAMTAGAVPTLMNSFWSDPELRVGIDLTTPSVVLADGPRAAQLARVAPEVAVLEFTPALFEQITTTSREPVDVPLPEEDAIALLMFTSGTTGRPKAVAHSHRSVIGTIQCNRFNTLLRLGAMPTSPPPPPRALLSPPLFHLSAVYGAVLMFLGAGGAIVLRPGRFDETRTMRAIQDERVTVWLSVGSAAPRVARHPDRDRFDLTSLVSVVVGGAPLSPAIKHELCAAFPNAAAAGGLRMGYTSSEGGSIVASIGGTAFAEHPESTGPIQDGLQVAIRDDEGRDLPPGGEGLIHVRSAYTMLEYWGDPLATEEVYGPGRWLCMGDVGRIEDGLLYVNSRARDLIFVSAENVYPSEVENRLEEHPSVLESCVVGIDDPVTGQAVKAFVVLPEEVTTDAEQLATWCREGLPPYKVPTAWDLRTERLPRNPAGKILRTALLAEEVVG